jgi:hypothetical protein
MEHRRELPALKWKLLNRAKLKKSNLERFEAQHRQAERFSAMA